MPYCFCNVSHLCIMHLWCLVHDNTPRFITKDNLYPTSKRNFDTWIRLPTFASITQVQTPNNPSWQNMQRLKHAIRITYDAARFFVVHCTLKAELCIHV